MENRIFIAAPNTPAKGCWVEITPDVEWDDLIAAYQAATGDSQPDELSITDAEGLCKHFGPSINLPGMIEVIQYAEDNDCPETVDDYLSDQHKWSQTHFEDSYCGEYESLDEYAEELFFEMFEVPDNIRVYIDTKSFARDLGYEGYWCSDNGHVFRPA